MKNLVLRPAFCTLVLLSAFLQSPPASDSQVERASPEAWQRILSFENLDLTKLDESSYKELFTGLKSYSPRWDRERPFFHVENATPPFHSLRYLWKIGTPELPARYVLIGADGLFIIPGDSRAEAYIFDSNGMLLSYEEFSLGWRAQFEEVKLMTDANLDVPLIEVLTSRPDLGSPEYYSLIGDHLALVRLDNSGKAIRNKFVASNWIIGPEVPKRSVAEWERSLLSDNPAEILRTLGWIGGKHWDLNIPPRTFPDGFESPSSDVKENAELVNLVRARPLVRARLEELSGSKNKWIREAAELALKPHDGDTSFCCGYASQ